MTDRDEADRALGAAVREALDGADEDALNEHAEELEEESRPWSADVFRAIAEALRKEREG